MTPTQREDRLFDPDPALDLHRKRQRDHADSLIARAEYLLPADRTLILALFQDHRRVPELARLMRVEPRHLRTRIRRLTTRMMKPEFAYVATRRDRWPCARRRIATACILHGLTLRAAAQSLDLRLHLVRKERDIVLALVETARQWKQP